MEAVQLTIDVLTALGALTGGVGTIVLDNKFNRLHGKAETLETGSTRTSTPRDCTGAEPRPPTGLLSRPPYPGTTVARSQRLDRLSATAPGESAQSDRGAASGGASARRQRRCIQSHRSGCRRT